MAFPADLATGLVTSALFEGLRKPFISFMALDKRRKEIIAGASGTHSHAQTNQSRRLESAMSDLTQVLATEFGAYTTSIERFLIELRSSAIPATLYNYISLGRDGNDLYPAFKLIYETFSPLPFPCEKLFSSYVAALRSHIDFSVKDPTLLEIIRKQHDDIKGEISKIVASLQQASTLKALTTEQFIEARLRVSKSIEALNRDIPVETERGTKRVPIKSLVIPARLQKFSHENLPASGEDIPDGPSEKLIDFRRSLRRAVVLGDPGGGKSTLTQHLCYDLAKRLTLDIYSNADKMDDRDIRLPIRVIVRTLDSNQKKNPSYSIIDYMVDDIKDAFDNDKNLAELFVVTILTTGKALLLFDGLDEVLEVARRKSMVSQIERFCTAYAGCATLITSRLVGYVDAPLAEEYQTVILSRLSPNEVELFAQKLIKAIGGQNRDPKALAAVFIKQTESNARDLRRNPLLLGLMVYIFMERGDVPNNRPEIYKACSQLLFLKWDQRRDIIFEYPDDFELLDLFGFIAVKIFGDSESEDGVTEEWILGHLRSFFSDWYNDQAKAVAASKALVNFITGRAWVMCDAGPKIYKFTHRTFLEYFVARRIESEAESVASLLEVLYPKAIAAQWDVVSHLALQMAASSGPKAEKAVDGLLALLNSHRRQPVEELNFISFFCRALEYLPVPDPKYQNAIQFIIDSIIELAMSFSFSSTSLLSVLSKSGRRKTKLTDDVLFGRFDHLCSSGDDGKTLVKSILMERDSLYRFKGSYDSLAAGEPWIAHIKNKYKIDFWEDALIEPVSAIKYYIIYGDRLHDIWNIHGIKLFYANADELAPSVYNNFRYIFARNVSFDLSSKNRSLEFEILDLFSVAICQKAVTPSAVVVSNTYIHEVHDIIDETWRALYREAMLTRKRPNRRSKLWIRCLIVLLTFVEEMQPYELSRPKYRRSKKIKVMYKRSKLFDRFLPPEIGEEILEFADRAGETTMFREWLIGERSFSPLAV
ncbi:hypothetical protein SLG_07760 [Sphingobium sp. SYK-6]|nr:hypothetical protein SLG_07760 [Sphingobium sp. SYK-6]